MAENKIAKHIEDAIEIMVLAGTAGSTILGVATAIVGAWKMAFPNEEMTVAQIAQILREKVARNKAYGEAEIARLDAIIAAENQ